MKYLNSVLIEGCVDTIDYEQEDTEEGKTTSAILHLVYPNIPIDITEQMMQNPTLDPISWPDVRIVGRLVDDGEGPYILAVHLERMAPRQAGLFGEVIYG